MSKDLDANKADKIVVLGDISHDFRGNIDLLCGRVLSGWIQSIAELNAPVSVQIYIDGQEAVNTKAALSRSDLNTDNIGDHAFNVELPERFYTNSHRIVDVRVAGNLLGGDNWRRQFFFPALTPRTSETGKAPGASRLKGFIDGLRDDLLLGWVFDEYAVGRTVELAIDVDGERIGTTIANLCRDDLVNVGINGHTFNIQFPTQLFTGVERHVVLSDAATGRSWENGTISLFFAEKPQGIPVPDLEKSQSWGSAEERRSIWEKNEQRLYDDYGSPTTLRGWVNPITGPEVTGWIHDDAVRMAPIEIEVIMDGSTIATKSVNPSKRYANSNTIFPTQFTVPIPTSLIDGLEHDMRVRVASNGPMLCNGSQKSILLPSLRQPQTSPWKESQRKSKGSARYTIIIDGLQGEVLSGWVFDSTEPTEGVWLDVYVDDKYVTTTQASIYRPDLKPEIGNPYHGFTVEMPEDLFNGVTHHVVMKIRNSKASLPGGDKLIYFPCRPIDNIVDIPESVDPTASNYLYAFPRPNTNLDLAETFDEAAYLTNYPDIAPAIAGGQFSSAYEHWRIAGKKEEDAGKRDGRWRRVAHVGQLCGNVAFAPREAVEVARLAELLKGYALQLENLPPVFSVGRSGWPRNGTLPGGIEKVANGRVMGWIEEAITTPTLLDIVIEGKVVSTALSQADGEVRHKNGGGTPRVDFNAGLPSNLFDGIEKAIFVVCRRTGRVLDGRPFYHTFEFKDIGVGDSFTSDPSVVEAERLFEVEMFDEARYLAAFPDIAQAIRTGHFVSAFEHWIRTGRDEERKGLRRSDWRYSGSLADLNGAAYLLNHQQAQELQRLGDILNCVSVYLKNLPAIRYSERCKLTEDVLVLEKLHYRPKISVVMPVYNVATVWLQAAIESVRMQSYPNWELCIVDDCSPSKHVKEVLEYYKKVDPRIKVRYQEEQGHISKASNAAIELATGEFIAFLDHDDEYTPDALLRMVDLLNKDPLLDYIYSDEDKINEDGTTFGAMYKPDWSPEILLTCMYTCHLSVYRASLLRSIGGLRPGFDGAQDFDLLLRFSANTNRVGHIPKVLYHWRTLATSTAQTKVVAKSYALERAEKALAEHISVLGFKGRVLPGPSQGMTRVQLGIIGNPKVSLVIPSAGRSATVNGVSFVLIENLVESIRSSSTYSNYEIIVVDNGDLEPGTMAKLDRAGVKRVTYRKAKFNLAEKMNLGARYASGDYLIIMNDDLEVITSNWIEEMLQFAQQKGVGVVGPKLLFPDDTIQHAGVMMLNGCAGHPYYRAPRNEIGHGGILLGPRNVVAVTGACAMFPTALFRQFKGFDEVFDLNYNDVDLCLRIHSAGYRNIYTPYAELYHFESMSRSDTAGKVRPEEFREFSNRWSATYFNDPYYNVNLPQDFPYGFRES